MANVLAGPDLEGAPGLDERLHHAVRPLARR